MTIINKAIWAMAVLTATGSGSFAAKLVEAGKPNASIIIAERAARSARLAAFELRHHVWKITGVELPIVTSPPDDAGVRILVGESDFTRLFGLRNAGFKDQEYLVKVDGNVIVLMGRDKDDRGVVDYADASTFPNIFDEVGSCYAVYDFLERLGVRWYLPTELGTTYEPSASLEIADVECRRAPFMKYREVYGAPYVDGLIVDNIDSEKKVGPLAARDVALFNLRQRLGGIRVRVNHSLYTFYDRFLKTHPEWFAKGYEGKPPQLCYSRPDVIQQVVRDAGDFFDGKVDAAKLISNVPPGFKSNVFPVFPMDNSLWCKCPACQATLKPKAERGAGQFSNDRASDYIFAFVNKVAAEVRKTYPDKFIGAGAYGEFCYPPENVKLSPNVVTTHCFHNRMVYAKHIQENDDIILNAWKKACPDNPKIIWMYYCFPTLTATYQQFRCFPGFFAESVGDYIKKYKDAGVIGLFVEPSYMGKPFRNGVLMDQPELYMNWKLADNPDLDPETLFNEFFERYYGKAAKPTREFYRLISGVFRNSRNYPPETKDQNEEIAWTRLGTKERMTRLGELMEQALAAADAEPFKRRVALLDQGVWQYMRKGARDYQERDALMAPTTQHLPAPRLTNKEPGNPLALNWGDAARTAIRYGMRADVIKRELAARFAHDGRFLYVLYEEKNIDPDRLRGDNITWLNDEWESFFAKQRGKPYRQLAVDAAGKWAAMDYEGTVNQPWDFKGRVISQTDRAEKTWRVYIAVPLDDAAINGVKPGETLYFNVIRAVDTQYLGSWVPTFGGFQAPSRFGEIYLEK